MSRGGQRQTGAGNGKRRLLDELDDRLRYKNPEGYDNPTCFYALLNVMREEKRRNRARDEPKRKEPQGKVEKKRFNTQVIYYDERGNMTCMKKSRAKGGQAKRARAGTAQSRRPAL